MGRVGIGFTDIAKIFVRTGASSFGGWSTTALLLEKELVEKRQVISTHQLKGGVTYAQILPGATQVSIVANIGYQLRGFPGALVATISYLLPAIGLITLFSIAYFHFAQEGDFTNKLDGVVAALGGIILANAYKIGNGHTPNRWLWALVGAAFVAKIVLNVNALIIIIIFGGGGLLISVLRSKRRQE